MRRLSSLLVLLVSVLGWETPAHAESRIALIIANGAYQNTSPLKNPVADGKLMAGTLEGLGFKVTLATDLDAKAMKKAMLEFGRALRASDSVGLFYYAGHAIQVAGENYLIPVDANLQDETEIGIEGVDVNDFLATMNEAQSRIKIVVLDACRNNPFPAASRSAARGLAIVRAPTGTLIAYSTSPGEVALDGTGDNSPYAEALSQAMKGETGKPIELVFRQARVEVLKSTEGQQTPWDLSSITGDFLLASGGGTEVSTGEAQSEATTTGTGAGGTTGSGDTATAAAKDYAVWVAIETSGNAAAYQAYLDEFPSGRFAAEAKKRLADAEAAEAQKQAALAAQAQAEAEAAAAAQQQQQQQEQQAPEPQGEEQAVIPSARQIQRMFPDSGKRRLSVDELYNLSCDELWVARNEMFDRRGYCFTSAKGQSFFDNADCTTSSQSILNKTEKANTITIKQVESEKGCP
ncbi:MAG: caspase family protein [Hyphomicrobiaceae bacterium]